MAQALVPLKDLVRAKTRLAGLLAPSERRALAQAMVEDVLALLAAHPDIDRVTLVSDDPSAYLLAAQYDAAHLSERSLGCSGLNEVINSASRQLLARHEQPLIVLHADLPLLDATDITAVLAAQRDIVGLVVASDRRGSGTNMLCFDRASLPVFCFGLDSCKRHIVEARAAGIPATVMSTPGIGLDIDEPRDLGELLACLQDGTAGRTALLLRDTDLGARIELALSSMTAAQRPLDQHGAG